MNIAVHAEPSPEAGAASSRERWPVRFRGHDAREVWGYGVWSLVALIVAVPEIWSLAGHPAWPTISATVAHLEMLWDPVAVIVVALIAAASVHVLRYPWHATGVIETRPGGQQRGRTPNGRFCRAPDEISEVSTYAYFAVAVAAVAAGGFLAALLSSDTWVLAYVIYGLIAIFCVIVPNALAFWFRKDVAFPTMFRTIADIEHRWHGAAVVIVAALAVLLVHLALYPWPDVVRHAGTGSP